MTNNTTPINHELQFDQSLARVEAASGNKDVDTAQERCRRKNSSLVRRYPEQGTA